jgi:hypothetical protein
MNESLKWLEDGCRLYLFRGMSDDCQREIFVRLVARGVWFPKGYLTRLSRDPFFTVLSHRELEKLYAEIANKWNGESLMDEIERFRNRPRFRWGKKTMHVGFRFKYDGIMWRVAGFYCKCFGSRYEWQWVANCVSEPAEEPLAEEPASIRTFDFDDGPPHEYTKPVKSQAKLVRRWTSGKLRKMWLESRKKKPKTGKSSPATTLF